MRTKQKPIAQVAPKYALFEGCIVVQMLNETTEKEGVLYRICAYLSAHRCNLVTRVKKLTTEQIAESIRLLPTEPLSYSYVLQSMLQEYANN